MITITFRLGSGEGVPVLDSNGRNKNWQTRITEDSNALKRVPGGWVIGAKKEVATAIKFPLTFVPDAVCIVEGTADDFERVGYLTATPAPRKTREATPAT